VFFLQAQSQPDVVSKRAERDLLFNRGLFGSSGAVSGTSSGIPADYGASSNGDAPPSANIPAGTRDDAVPADRSSGDTNHMAETVATSTVHTLGQDAAVITSTSQEQTAALTHPSADDDDLTHTLESGRVPMSQSPGRTPSANPMSMTRQDAPINPITTVPNSAPDASSGLNVEDAAEEVAQEIIEEVVPESADSNSESELSVIIQQLLKTAQAAVDPAQGLPPHPRSRGATPNCLLPGDQGAELAVLLIDGLLVCVDAFQQEGNFPAAIALMAKVNYASVNRQSAHT